jgi:hypothetical protein
LQYADTPLLLDFGHEVASFLNKWQSLDELYDQADPVWKVEDHSGSLGPLSGLGLTCANDTPPPNLKINQLYWPTGASRWARGYFLVDAEGAGAAGIAKILDEITDVDGETVAKELRADFDPTGADVFATDMFMLPPRAIFGTKTKNDFAPLYLIPLVDARYFWQFKDIGDIDLTTVTSWDTLFSAFDTQLGITLTIDDAIESVYLKPDIDELLNRNYENAAQLLDAATLSVGRRIVHRFDNTFHALTWDQSGTDRDLDLDSERNIAGNVDDVAPDTYATMHLEPYPSQVRIVFPRYSQRSPDASRKAYAYVKPATTFTTAQTAADTTKTIYSTAYADFSGGGGTPDNHTALDAIATQIAQDYYDSLLYRHDITFTGTYPTWLMNGYDDFALFDLGTEHRGERVVTSRFQSIQHNWYPSVLMHRDSLAMPEMCLAQVQAQGITARTGTTTGVGTVKIQQVDSSDDLVVLQDDGADVELDCRNYTGTSVAANEYVLVLREGNTARFVAVAPGSAGESKWIRFQLTEDMGATLANQASAAVLSWWGGSHPDPSGQGLQVHDRNEWRDTARYLDKGYAVWDSENALWSIVELDYEPTAKWIHAELLEDISTTGFAEVALLSWWGGRSPTASPLYVFDQLGIYGHLSGTAQSGGPDQVLATYDEDAANYVQRNNARRVRRGPEP